MLSGGGFNSNFNNRNSNADKSTVDRCYDGLGNYVCGDKQTPTPVDQPTDAPPTPRPTKRPTTPSPVDQPLPPSKKATKNPTKKPTPNPSRIPTPSPSPAPSVSRVTNAPTESGDVTYAIRVSTEIIWLTYSYDFRDVAQTIDDILFGYLSEKYLGVKTTIDDDGKVPKGPYCASPCYYIYGFNTVPVVMQDASETLKEAIVAAVNDGSYNEAICNLLTEKYANKEDTGLRCYRVTGTVETVTQNQYSRFIGDLDNDGVPFDTLNLESYSGADIFVLLIFLSFICCACWCIGWYSHKKKFSKELEKELNLAANFNPQMHENDIRRQMAANNQPDVFERGIGKFRR